MAHNIKIYWGTELLTVDEAIAKNLVYRDENNDVYLTQDVTKLIKIKGEVHLPKQ